jgi:voltage-gated potassium channel
MVEPVEKGWKEALFGVIFESRTRAGRAFDVALIATILASVAVVILASVSSVRAEHGPLLVRLEWIFTALFTIEYILRLTVVARPRSYALSFFGVVDLLAIVPSYLSLLVPGAQSLLVIRVLRIVRVFHVLDLPNHKGAATVLVTALRAARYPVAVFLLAFLALITFIGTVMYVVEGESAGVTSIPVGIYWAVVTLTTLGYGDIVPLTSFGRAITTGIVVLGYWAVAIAVAIVSVELSKAARDVMESEASPCAACGATGHADDARFCRACGDPLPGREAAT